MGNLSIKNICFVFILILILPVFSGCYTIKDTDIFLEKSTVFGLEVTEPTGHTKLRFGLVRNFYQKIPTSTNGPIYSPVYSTSMKGEIGFASQDVEENYSIGNTNIIK